MSPGYLASLRALEESAAAVAVGKWVRRLVVRRAVPLVCIDCGAPTPVGHAGRCMRRRPDGRRWDDFEPDGEGRESVAGWDEA